MKKKPKPRLCPHGNPPYVPCEECTNEYIDKLEAELVSLRGLSQAVVDEWNSDRPMWKLQDPIIALSDGLGALDDDVANA